MECNSRLPWAILALFPALLIVCVCLLSVHPYKFQSHSRAEKAAESPSSNTEPPRDSWGLQVDVISVAEFLFLIISAEQSWGRTSCPHILCPVTQSSFRIHAAHDLPDSGHKHSAVWAEERCIPASSHPVETAEHQHLPRLTWVGRVTTAAVRSSLPGHHAHDFVFLTLGSTECQAAVTSAVICCFSQCTAVFRLLREERFGA